MLFTLLVVTSITDGGHASTSSIAAVTCIAGLLQACWYICLRASNFAAWVMYTNLREAQRSFSALVRRLSVTNPLYGLCAIHPAGTAAQKWLQDSNNRLHPANAPNMCLDIMDGKLAADTKLQVTHSIGY
jgi:hypothetical protein